MARFILGVDGGGTHARALLVTPEGHIIAEGHGGPANFQAVGEEVTCASIEDAMEAALGAAPGGPLERQSIAGIAAGLAGLHVRADYERFATLLHALLPHSKIMMYNDGEVALAAATGGKAGIVVVAGTGSISFGSDGKGRMLRCGGWGYLLGDEGSAYAIVLAAFRAASYADDGRAPASALVSSFCDALDVATFDDILRPVYGPPTMTRHQIAALAPLVTQCAVQGDNAALRVLEEAARDLATMPVALARRLGLGDELFPVGCSGGVWQAGEPVLEPFRRAVVSACPQAVVGPPLLTPSAGAALLGIEGLTGRTIDPTIIENLRARGVPNNGC